MNFRFREIREELELKQHEVANRIGLSRGGYSNIEAETANIKLKDFLNYCNTFNCTMNYVAKLADVNKSYTLTKINKIDKHIISKRLSLLEKDNGKEAKDIAKLLGIAKSTYSNYKNVNKNNTIQTLMLRKLSQEYGYTMDWLIGRSEKKY